MATYTVQSVDEDGLDITFSAVASTDNFANDGKTLLLVKNGSGGNVQIDITSQVTTVEIPSYGNVTKADRSITIANGAQAILGPFNRAAFNDGSGLVEVTYDVTTSVTAAAISYAD